MREIYGVCGAMSRRSLEAEGHPVGIKCTSSLRLLDKRVGMLRKKSYRSPIPIITFKKRVLSKKSD